jgi:hypothetical protein
MSWKPVAPIGVLSSNIRPLTNKDYTNTMLAGSHCSRVYANTKKFIPRPMKHYRKGRLPIHHELADQEFISFGNNRNVRTSKSTNWQDMPASAIITPVENTYNKMHSDIYTNPEYITDNPTKETQTSTFCCNLEQKARRRVQYSIRHMDTY